MKKLKIAYILPKLVNQGPISVTRDIILGLKDYIDVVVFYFDEVSEEEQIDFPCVVKKIKFFEKIDFDSFDVVHSHMFRPDLYVWLHRKNKGNKTFFISTLHQNIYDNLKGNYNLVVASLFEKIWIKLLNKQDVVVTLTDVMKKFYDGKINARLERIYNGRSLKESECIDNQLAIEITELKEKYNIIGNHSLLTKRKGIDQIIFALRELPDCAAVIIGDGKELESLKSLAKDLNVFDRCLFTGYIANATDYLKFFDLYVLSSRSEGMPLSLLEVGQKKIPVVCSNLDVFREILTEHEVCFFTLEDKNSLINSIHKCLNNKDFYAENLYCHVTNNFSNQRMSENYYKLYIERELF